MADEVRFKVNRAGFYEVRRMPKLQTLLENHAQDVADRANTTVGNPDGYPVGTTHFATSSRQGRTVKQGRWRASIVTATAYARRYDAKHQLLLKLLGGAR